MRYETLRRVLNYTKPYLPFIGLSLVGAIISIALTLASPVVVGWGVDYIIGPGNVDFGGILRICGWLVALLLVSALFQWLMSYFMNIATSRTVRDLRAAVFGKLNRVPLRYIDRHSHGDLISRIVNDIDAVSDGLLQGFNQLFSGVVTILGTLGFMLYINWMIALVVVVLTPLSIFVASFIAKHSHAMFQKQYAIQGQLGGYIEEMVGSQKVVKAFRYEDRAQQQFEQMNRELYKYGVRAQFYSALANPSTRFVNGLVSTAVGIFGVIAVLNNAMTVGQVSAFLTYANQYTKPFNEITGVLTQLQSAFASAARLFEVLDEPDIEPDAQDAAVLDHCRGDVDLQQVSFSYQPNTKLIQDLNVRVKSGDKVAIVGPTGSGKTTIVNLLMRFYDVDGGRILVDGLDIRRIRRQSLRRSFGMVLQETWLFSGTIRENIAFGKKDATIEEVEAAAKAAHAHNFIMRLPQGYDTPVLEDGSNISQGQKQLLCIARVMLTAPPMLILDEATSNIDTRTEVYIQKAFDQLMEGRTSFVVAHRLSTIREADTILVMNQGAIVEQGTHDQLLARNGFYAHLYNSQFAGTEQL